jgi:hypothetical protein
LVRLMAYLYGGSGRAVDAELISQLVDGCTGAAGLDELVDLV